MAYLNSCTELDDLGKGRFRQVHHIKPIAYLENGVYKLASTNVVAAAGGTYTHAVLTASMGVRIGDDGKYAVHPTRELARYVAFGGPQVKVGGKWTAVPFADPVRKDNSVVWTQKQADLRLTHIGHGLKHEMWLKGGYVPEDNLIAVAVNLVGLTRSGSTLLADGVPVARIQAPVVYDAANRLDTRPIKWDVVARDGQPYIVYTLPDLTGMKAPVIDPTLTLQPDAAAGEDTWLYSHADWVGYNAGVSTALLVGRYSLGVVGRSLIRFSLAAIPALATCDSATLTLTNTGNAAQTAAVAASVYHVSDANGDWVEGTKNATRAGAGEPCWNAKEADGAGGVTTAWAGSVGCGTSGTDYAAVAIGTGNLTDDPDGTAYDIALNTTTVQGWFGDATNNGMFIRGNDEVTDGKYFVGYSSDHATASYRPKLVVDYTLPASGAGGMLLLGVG